MQSTYVVFFQPACVVEPRLSFTHYSTAVEFSKAVQLIKDAHIRSTLLHGLSDLDLNLGRHIFKSFRPVFRPPLWSAAWSLRPKAVMRSGRPFICRPLSCVIDTSGMLSGSFFNFGTNAHRVFLDSTLVFEGKAHYLQ